MPSRFDDDYDMAAHLAYVVSETEPDVVGGLLYECHEIAGWIARRAEFKSDAYNRARTLQRSIDQFLKDHEIDRGSV